jgi:hypothetical protein
MDAEKQNATIEAPPTLAELQEKMANLERFKAEIVKAFYDDYEQTCRLLHEAMGANAYFQDAHGTVYKTIEPDGTFVRFSRYAVARTRFPGETKGSLSMTEAREAGFVVEGK